MSDCYFVHCVELCYCLLSNCLAALYKTVYCCCPRRLNLLPALLFFCLDLETFITALSEHIGNDWKVLARALELSKTDIDAIEYENRFNLKDQIYEFFYKWRQQKGKNVSIQKLIRELQEWQPQY